MSTPQRRNRSTGAGLGNEFKQVRDTLSSAPLGADAQILGGRVRGESTWPDGDEETLGKDWRSATDAGFGYRAVGRRFVQW